MDENFKRDLQLHIRARFGIIGIKTVEEETCIEEIFEVGTNCLCGVYIFSEASGFEGGITPYQTNFIDHAVWKLPLADVNNTEMIQVDSDSTPRSPSPLSMMDALEAIRVKKSFEEILWSIKPIGDKGNGKEKLMPSHATLFVIKGGIKTVQEDRLVQRKLLDMYGPNLRSNCKTIIFVAPEFDLPEPLKSLVPILELPLPDEQRIEDILCAAIYGLNGNESDLRSKLAALKNPDEISQTTRVLNEFTKKKTKIIDQLKTNKKEVIQLVKGMTAYQIENTFAKCIILGDFSLESIKANK